MKDAIGIADLAALVTVAGVSVYVAGLLGLALAIRLRLTDDIGTAWYAVSLLPRTDVAGQGVGIWLRWPLPIAVVIVVLDTLGEDIGAFDTAKFDPLISLSGLVVLGLFAVQILRRLDYEKVTERHSHPLSTRSYITAIVTAAAGSLFMSIGALRVVQGAREATLPVLQALTHGVFSGTIFFLVGGLFVGVAGAAVLDNPLPHVIIKSDPTAVNLPALKGNELYLVTHAEGHWHILDDASNELLSVPDRLVWSVHTFKKKTPKDPAVKKGRERKKWWQRIVEFFGYRTQDEALQAYLDVMSQLLTDEKRPLRRAQIGDSLSSSVARARTVRVLPRLDGERKARVVQFLYGSGLIAKKRPIIDLQGADLQGANLRGADLFMADLKSASLREADLRGADLFMADLKSASLRLVQEGWTVNQLRAAKSLEDATMSDGKILRGKANPYGPTFDKWVKEREDRKRDAKNA